MMRQAVRLDWFCALSSLVLLLWLGWIPPVEAVPRLLSESGGQMVTLNGSLPILFSLDSLIADLHHLVPAVLSQIQQWGVWGGFAFVGLYAVATVALIPGSLLTVGAGAAYGVWQGSLYVFLGASLGAILAFSIGRYLVRDWVAAKIQSRSQFQAIDTAIGKAGFKIVVLSRLSPIFPFTLLNYALGITQVSWQDYVLGCIGMLPGTLLYVYLGSIAGSLAQAGAAAATTQTELQWIGRGVGFIATLAVTLYTTQIARQALENQGLKDTSTLDTQD